MAVATTNNLAARANNETFIVMTSSSEKNFHYAGMSRIDVAFTCRCREKFPKVVGAIAVRMLLNCSCLPDNRWSFGVNAA
jgi:hypothetical protein